MLPSVAILGRQGCKPTARRVLPVAQRSNQGDCSNLSATSAARIRTSDGISHRPDASDGTFAGCPPTCISVEIGVREMHGTRWSVGQPGQRAVRHSFGAESFHASKSPGANFRLSFAGIIFPRPPCDNRCGLNFAAVSLEQKTPGRPGGAGNKARNRLPASWTPGCAQLWSNRVDAQSRAHGGRVVPGQAPADSVAGRRGMVLGHPGRRGPRQ